MSVRSPRLVVALLTAAALLGGGAAYAQSVSPGAAIGNAQRGADAIEALRADPELAHLLDTDPALKKKLQQAYAKLALANDALASGRPYADAEAREYGIAAGRDFAAIENAVRAKWEKARAAAVAAEAREQEELQRVAVRAESDALAAEAKELLARPAPSDPAVLERRGELGRALQAHQRLGRDASLASLRTVRDALATAGAAVTSALRRSPALPVPAAAGDGVAAEARPHPAPEKLRLAIAAYLGGDYRRAADLLAVADLGDDRATKVAHLVRGAARFALWVESGERDGALLEQARADVRACQRLDPGVAPAPSLFSPRYADLFAR